MVDFQMMTEVFIGAEFAIERFIVLLLLLWGSLSGKLPLWVPLCIVLAYGALTLGRVAVQDKPPV